MQAAGHAIELDEAGREPGQAALLLPEFLDRFDRVHDLILHRQALALEAVFAHRVDFLLHFIEQVVDFVLLLVGTARALGAGGDDLAQDVFVAHDVEIIPDVGRRRDKGEEAGHKRRAADGLEQVPVAQDLGECDQVDALIGVPKVDQRGVNRLVRRDIKIFFVNLLDGFADRFFGRDEHRTEHALLRFDAVREGAVNIR